MDADLDLPPEELDFHFLAGRLCLDLVATVGERWRRAFERMPQPADLDRWLARSSLGLEGVAATAVDLDDAHRLREAIDRAARGLPRGRSPDAADLAIVNDIATRPALAPQLVPGGGIAWAEPVSAPAALATVARDAVALLGGPDAGRVRECARDDCALLFVDASRPGTRRWCSMQGCGNRTKTASYRRRKGSRG